MHWVLIFGAAIVYVMTVSPMATALTVVGIAIVTFVAEKTANAVTGASITTTESLRSVGMALLFLFSFALIALLSGAASSYDGVPGGALYLLSSAGMPLAGLGCMLAYTAGFKFGMEIDFWVAGVVALVTSFCSVLLFAVSQAIL